MPGDACALRHLRYAKTYIEESFNIAKQSGIPHEKSKRILEKLSTAAEHLNTARKLNPEVQLDNKVTQNHLACMILVGEGRAYQSVAWEYEQEATRHYEKHKFQSFAFTRKQKRHLEEAAKAFEKAATYIPDNTLALKSLAECYEKLGRARDYNSTLERLAQIDPQDQETQTKLHEASLVEDDEEPQAATYPIDEYRSAATVAAPVQLKIPRGSAWDNDTNWIILCIVGLAVGICDIFRPPSHTPHLLPLAFMIFSCIMLFCYLVFLIIRKR